jgi:NAD(P)-dependent dehydrogenase (short-subunit alcohol dehydrogenase family)
MDAGDDIPLPALPASGRLGGKVAVVTGAGSAGPIAGVGSATAVVLAAAGAKVLLVDIDPDRAAATRRLIDRIGGEAVAVTADITRRDDCDDAIALAVSRFGGVSVLVNSAAIYPVEEPSDDDAWERALSVNLTGARNMMNACLPALETDGRAAVVNISSVAAIRAGGAGAAYVAAKGALVSLTSSWAFRYGPRGVRVNCIVAGNLHTPMSIAGQQLDEERRALRRNANMLLSEGSGWDVGYCALFLASDEARWITAAAIPVDAGSSQLMPLSALYRYAETARGGA